MTTETNHLSRRKLLASIPAAAAAMAPVAATALCRRTADDWRVQKLAETLETMSDEDLEFIIRALQAGKQDRANDAELMALKPEFDQMFDTWWARWEDSMEHSRAVEAAVQERHPELSWDEGRRLAFLDNDSPELKAWMTARRALEASIGRRYPERNDEETEEDSNKELVLTDEILSHRPVTREGLALQCRALIMFGYDDSYRTRAFVSGVANFLFLDIPEGLAKKRLVQDDGDEEYEDD